MWRNSILQFWHDSAGFSWGASIIMLTVCVRLAILPLTFKQVRSMQDLQRLQPEMKRIQERYKDDRQRMNQEMMKLYQEHKVNPLGSCLPILLQLPFFIALFYLLRGDEFQQEHRGRASRFLFIDEPRRAGDRRDARGPDRPLRVDAADLGPRLDRHRGPDAAPDHARAAVRLRHLHHQLRGRPDRLLDHDEHVDDRPAVPASGSCSRSPSRSRRKPTPGRNRPEERRRPRPRRPWPPGRARRATETAAPRRPRRPGRARRRSGRAGGASCGRRGRARGG